MTNGLIEGLQYIRDEKTGKINWFKMIPEEHLYLNQDRKASIEKRTGKNLGEVKISEALDTELVINLSGIRYLLDVRGYTDVDIDINAATPEYAAATCKIKFIANEDDSNPQTFTGNASAHPGNTKSWYAQYLIEAASNRALCRAVRFYLNINVVSKEELGADATESPKQTGSKQVILLEELMKKKNVKWVQVVAKLKKDDEENTKKLTESGQMDKFVAKWDERYTSVADLPKDIIFDLIEKIKKI